MHVSVIGTGYVGLVTGCCLAEAGHIVTCIDNDAEKVARLQKGVSPIFEAGLDNILSSNITRGRLSFSTDITHGVENAEIIFLALPTPPKEDGSADLTAVLNVARQLGPSMPARHCVVVNKSTVPVGTAEKVRSAISANTTRRFDVASNPEFLREGRAVGDFMNPERIVIGVSNKKSETALRKLYAPFTKSGAKLFVTSPQTAELSKYAANTFLTTKVNFMNEIAQLCELMDADIDSLRDIIGSDSRIGHKFLHPGIGAGGSCFPKDVRALKKMADEHGYDFRLIEAAIAVNRQQHHVLVDKIKDHHNGNLHGKTFAVWGLAFKPDTDDIREAPALNVIDELVKVNARVVAYDPKANHNVRRAYADEPLVTVVDTKEEALKDADALVVATEWSEFKGADLKHVRDSLASPVVFDGRNIFTPEEMKASGFSYYSIGRRPVIA